MSRRKMPEEAMLCVFVLDEPDAVPVPEARPVVIECRVGLWALARALAAAGLMLRYDSGRRVFFIEVHARD